MYGDGRRIGSAWLTRRKQMGAGSAASFLYQNGRDSNASNFAWTNWFIPPVSGGGILLPLKDYPTGLLITPAGLIPDSAADATISIARKTTANPAIWPTSTTNISINAEISLDGGITWKPYGGLTATGDIYPGLHGVEATATRIKIDLPIGTNRLIRAVSNISGNTLRSLVSLTYGSPPIGGTYTTTFPVDENPVSEGGVWSNIALDWAKVRTIGGEAQGTQTGTNNFDDSITVFTPDYGTDYEIEGTIFRSATPDLSGDSHEIEMHLRVQQSPHSIFTYEVNLGYGGSSFYSQIVKWNGPLGTSEGDFTFLTGDGGTFAAGVVTGDRFKARIVGSLISVFLNDVFMYSFSDASLTTGQPGFGFFRRPNGTNAEFGFTKIVVKKL